MLSRTSPIPPLTKDNLYLLIAMNQAPLSRKAMLEIFGADEVEETNLLLRDMEADGSIFLSDKGYIATKPWADIAYAIVGPVSGDNRVSVQIANLPDDIDLSVTMSRDEVRRRKLKEGDRIVVGLLRGSRMTGLRARYLNHAKEDRPHRLTGIFNNNSKNFTPIDRSIKTGFILAQPPEDHMVPRQFLVEMPRHFDIRNPVIDVVPDQTLDGDTGDTISQIIIRKHKIATVHPESVLREAEFLARQKVVVSGNRVDLRSLYFVTVDPPDSGDYDDAIYGEAYEDGFAVYSAIADLPALVPYNCEVDREAYARGTTYYMGKNDTCHMHPPILSINKASLIANANRYAIVLKQIWGPDGALKNYDFFPAVIRSRKQLTYGQFSDLIDRADPRFRILVKAFEARRNNGLEKSVDSKSIIQASMIQTNTLMAQFLNNAGVTFLSRNYVQNDPENPNVVQRAYYSSKHVGHAAFGEFYAHGSSPIRRYADKFNQHGMHTVFGTPDIGLHDEQVANIDIIARHLNGRRDIEQRAQHDEEKYHVIRELARLVNTDTRINLQEIGEDHIDVIIIQTGLRHTIQKSALAVGGWAIDQQKRELVLLDENGGELRRYSQGDGLLGRVGNVDCTNASWSMILVRPKLLFPSKEPHFG